MRRRDIESALRSECDAYGVTPTFGSGKRHPYVEVVDRRGRRWRVTYAATPSDGRGLLNARAELRRAFRGAFA